ncbi:ribosomal RNA-processing protein 7 homolog A [Engystomops pustulosus]|uniref:ribosomal RNA-processing protein 7 homolog A n=1 Tax=Engystomops pustulosus TaxID=76066 RepID=UPI003AFA03B6
MAPSKAVPTLEAADGYIAVPVRFSEEEAPHHCFYATQEHLDDTRPRNRTLFVINIPGYITEDALSEAFSSYGSVESVEILDKPGCRVGKPAKRSTHFNQKMSKGFKVAYIVFKKEFGIEKFSSALVISKEDNFIKAGIEKWISDYEASFIDVAALQAEIDKYMDKYDGKEKKKEVKAKEKEGVPDKEGWITVTRKGRRPGTVRTEAMNSRLVEKERKKRAQKELINFYTWQQRTKTKEHLDELRKKFEEDKQKIALMRAQRKFRPY